MATRKTAAAEAPAAETLTFSDTSSTEEVPNTDVADPGSITEELPENTEFGAPGDQGIAEEPWQEPLYPVNEEGVPEADHPFFPGDDVAFILEFLEHLTPELFDRTRQRFMQARNEERAA